MGELAALAEVADILGVSKQRALTLTNRPDFPAPVDTLEVGRIWRRADVIDWNARRPGRIVEDEQA